MVNRPLPITRLQAKSRYPVRLAREQWNHLTTRVTQVRDPPPTFIADDARHYKYTSRLTIIKANPISTSNRPTSNNIPKIDDTAFSKTEATIPDRTASSTDKMPQDTPFDNNNNGSDPDGPHHTHTANILDPRVNPDTEDRKPINGGLSSNSHAHTHGPDPSAPHANEAAPRVDSNQIDGHGTNGLNSIPKNPNNAAEGGSPDPHQNTDKTGVVGGHGNPFVTTDKSTERSSNPGPISNEPKIKQQGAANPNDDPTGEQEDAEDFLKTKDPNDHSGEPMHMHTGGPGEGGEVPRTQEERRDSSLGQPGQHSLHTCNYALTFV